MLPERLPLPCKQELAELLPKIRGQGNTDALGRWSKLRGSQSDGGALREAIIKGIVRADPEYIRAVKGTGLMSLARNLVEELGGADKLSWAKEGDIDATTK